MDMNDAVLGTNFHISQLADDTKIYGVVNTVEDEENLQFCINRFEGWVARNELDLNATKTYHVAYWDKHRYHGFRTTYYVNGTQIQCKTTIKDLGITFDRRLTFKAHIEDISGRALRSYGAAYRFVTEVRCPRLILKILSIYIMPILEYCSPVWSPAVIAWERRLDQVVRMSTRLAIGSAFRRDHQGYLPFNTRLQRCNLVNTATRRRYLNIMTAVKFLKEETHTSLLQRMELCKRNRVTAVRDPRIFDLPHDLHRKSPLYEMLREINDTRDLFNFNDSTQGIRKLLRDNLLHLPAVNSQN